MSNAPLRPARVYAWRSTDTAGSGQGETRGPYPDGGSCWAMLRTCCRASTRSAASGCDALAASSVAHQGLPLAGKSPAARLASAPRRPCRAPQRRVAALLSIAPVPVALITALRTAGVRAAASFGSWPENFGGAGSVLRGGEATRQ